MDWEAAVQPFADPGVTAYDFVDKNMISMVETTADQLDVFSLKTQIISYSLPADSSGNKADDIQRVVVVKDTTKPVSFWSISSHSDVVVGCECSSSSDQVSRRCNSVHRTSIQCIGQL